MLVSASVTTVTLYSMKVFECHHFFVILPSFSIRNLAAIGKEEKVQLRDSFWLINIVIHLLGVGISRNVLCLSISIIEAVACM